MVGQAVLTALQFGGQFIAAAAAQGGVFRGIGILGLPEQGCRSPPQACSSFFM